MQIRVSEQFLDGFTKTAVAAGIPQDKVPQLFKLAQQLQARAANPETFDAGMREVFEKQGINLSLRPLIYSLLGGLGLAGGVGLGKSLRNNSADAKFFSDALNLKKMNSKRRLQQAILDSTDMPSSGGSALGVSRYGNYVPGGIPF